MVKKLIKERNSKPPIPTPVKDTTVVGHVPMNQESFVQSSQAILQGLAEGGYIHTKTPKFECFFGDEKKNKLDFDMWERQILSAATTHSGAAIRTGKMQSLKGQALMVTSALPPEASWEKLFQDKAPYDVLMSQFYGTKIELEEKCASFGTRLEQKLIQVSLQYPNKISEDMYCAVSISCWLWTTLYGHLLSIVVAVAFTLVVVVMVQITLGNVVRVYPGTVQGLTFYLSKIYI